MTSLGCGGSVEDVEEDAEAGVGAGRGDSGLQSRRERCLVMKRTIGEVRKSSSVHCSHRSRSVVSVGVSRWRGVGVVIVGEMSAPAGYERWGSSGNEQDATCTEPSTQLFGVVEKIKLTNFCPHTSVRAARA